MQKVVTIAIDTTQLNPQKTSAFSVTEADEVNELLELGWQIEEWDFLREGETDGQVVLLVILNDDLMYEDDQDDFDVEFGAEDDGDYEEQDAIKNKN